MNEELKEEPLILTCKNNVLRKSNIFNLRKGAKMMISPVYKSVVDKFQVNEMQIGDKKYLKERFLRIFGVHGLIASTAKRIEKRDYGTFMIFSDNNRPGEYTHELESLCNKIVWGLI